MCSFHGILDSPQSLRAGDMTGIAVLAHHGQSDPMVSPEGEREFREEMETRSADWQLCVHGNAVHAFMRPDKTAEADAEAGLQYNASVAERAWQSMVSFLLNVLQAG